MSAWTSGPTAALYALGYDPSSSLGTVYTLSTANGPVLSRQALDVALSGVGFSPRPTACAS